MTGCRVSCIEMAPDFCTGAALLNQLTGLDDRIEVLRGSAFEDTSDAHLAMTVTTAPSPLTLGVFVDNLAQKSANARRSLEERPVRLVRGIFRAA